MPRGLAFTLYAPLASMGDIAVGEERGGFDRPARSAILGLIAAALGFDRHDEAAHAALDSGYRMAQRVRRSGTLVEDYHTVQAPAAERNANWATRKQALAAAQEAQRLETLLSNRSYRADALVDIVLLRAGETGPEPEALVQALKQPTYILSFGRKACPLGLPPYPLLLPDVASLGDAFAALDTTRPTVVDRLLATLTSAEHQAPVYVDLDLAPWLAPDYEPLRIERRRDRVTSRRRWQFALRHELVAEPVAAPGGLAS